VLVDWRGGALPNEPTKIRPAIVVEDHELFPDGYPNTIVVPLTQDERLAYAGLSERLEPTEENGSAAVSWALAHHVASVSLTRVRVTASRISSEQLTRIRQRIAVAIGNA
jgi:mRNA interferase MazF